MKNILLASSSSYRQALLGKLGLHFEAAAPDIDESQHPNEPITTLVQRLALAKAKALAEAFPQHLIIGSDQLASLDGQILGKPGNFSRAFEQLRQCQGQTVRFYTGLCLLNPEQNHHQLSLETYSVTFRPLTDRQITRYLELEEPYDCAGSFKSEGLGISLFNSLQGEDPNTLVGLPLIALIRMLNKEGIDPLMD